MVSTPRTTVDGWKKSDGWDEAKPLDRGRVHARSAIGTAD
ncbi:hypothetical protein [Psychrobacter sp. KH172YL61]|nr:hypothetical protein [Psychrobacter sp. KH172YL61]